MWKFLTLSSTTLPCLFVSKLIVQNEILFLKYLDYYIYGKSIFSYIYLLFLKCLVIYVSRQAICERGGFRFIQNLF